MVSRNIRWALRSSAALLLLVVTGLGLYTWLHWSPPAPLYRPNSSMHGIELPLDLRSGTQHDAALTRNGGNPYILEIQSADAGAILYYGASHSRDPHDPQLADIEGRWYAFGPTVALCEGRDRGYFYGSLIEPFAGLPEPALIHKLAQSDEVPLYSLEPSYADEVAGLLEQFDPEQVALYFFLRVYVSEAAGTANEGLAKELLLKRTRVEGLQGVFPSLAEVDRVWYRDFPKGGDWRTLKTLDVAGYLAAINRESQRIRGEHMLRVLIDLARQGERVFAVVGSGHVIRQEWNLRAVFGQPPAWDQPDRDS